jgi:hypothetical protein
LVVPRNTFPALGDLILHFNIMKDKRYIDEFDPNLINLRGT